MAGMAGDVRIGILCPLEVRVGFGEPVEVVGPRLRTLLVRLALDPDRVVLISQLVDAVWGEEPPARSAPASAVVSPKRLTRPSAWIAYRMSAPVSLDHLVDRSTLDPTAEAAVVFRCHRPRPLRFD